MDEFQTSEQLKDFILNYRSDTEEELGGVAGPCYGLSWKRDGWVIRQNKKKLGKIEAKDLPKGFNLQSPQFLADALAILRKSGMDGLNKYLRALKRDAKRGSK